MLSFDTQEPLAVSGPDIGSESRTGVRAIVDAHLTNAASLRAELARLGHACQGGSDAEIVAHAYAAWGPSCATRLRGPFACAIWDECSRRLVLVRDHMGIRPLYFAIVPNEGIAFASDLRVLRADPRIGGAWSPAGIDAYLRLGYIPAPLTPYQRISKLEPAQMVVVDGRRLRAERYWEPRPSPASSRGSQVVDALEQQLEAAVRRELRAGEVTGILYSGGLASTTLLAASPKSAGKAITVAIDQDCTELARGDAAAVRLGHVRELETTTAPIPALVGHAAAQLDEPIADPEAVAQVALCSAARRQAGCVLAAHGASLLWDGGQRPQLWDGFHRREIYTRGFAWQVRDAEPLSDTCLADSTLAAAHRAAAAAGIALRFPFLEPQLVQLALTHSVARGPMGRRRPSAFQQLLARRLPRPLLPAASSASPRWWVESALTSLVPSCLLTPRFDARGIVSRPALLQRWNEHRAGRGNHTFRLWALVMLEYWFREFVDDRAAGEPLEYAALVRVA